MIIRCATIEDARAIAACAGGELAIQPQTRPEQRNPLKVFGFSIAQAATKQVEQNWRDERFSWIARARACH